MRRLSVVLILAGVSWLGFSVAAWAHPLGDVSVNIHNGIVVSPHEVRVEHIVDLAEVPTVQAMPDLDTDRSGTVSPSELSSFARSRCSATSRELSLTMGGAAAPLTVRGASASTGEGQAGLPTLRIECSLAAPVSVADGMSLAFEDDSASADIGWREVTLQGDLITIADSDVPDTSPSQLLTSYPEEQLSSPPRVAAASASVGLGGQPLEHSPQLTNSVPPTGSWSPWEWGGDLLGRVSNAATSPLAMAMAFVVALVVGAVHALAPGHGKSLVAFALAGRQERAARAAVTVGVTVTAAHTFSVLALAFLAASAVSVAPGAVYGWIQSLTAILVVALGLFLLLRALRGRGEAHTHSSGSAHDPAHGSAMLHDHSHAHDHSHEDTAPKTVTTLSRPEHTVETEHRVHLPEARKGVLVTLGLTGGLVPSPSAVVVLLATISAGRAWFGVLLVLAFGAGMALTLGAVGFAVVRGQARLLALADSSTRAWAVRLVSLVPAITATCVLILGLALLAASTSL